MIMGIELGYRRNGKIPRKSNSHSPRLELFEALEEDFKEVHDNIGRFQELNLEESIAVLFKVTGFALDDPKSREATVKLLALLSQLNIPTVAVHGAGKQFNEHLKGKKYDGVRATSEVEVKIYCDPILQEINEELVSDINRKGGKAFGMSGKEVLTLRPHPMGSVLDRVGEVDEVNRGAIIETIGRYDHIPIITPIGYDRERKLRNVTADGVLRALIPVLMPKKTILTTEAGGVLGSDGKIIEEINLLNDYDALKNSGAIKGGMVEKLKQIDAALKGLGEGRETYAIRIEGTDDYTNLLRAIFTNRGNGTLIKPGYKINEHNDFGSLDKDKLSDLIESSLERRLTPGYFEETGRNPLYVLIGEDYNESYKGAAVVLKFDGFHYLDKYVVAPAHQSNGLGKILWKEMQERSPRLIWRAKPINPFNTKYFEQSGGYQRTEKWNIFWRGSFDDETLIRARNYAEAKPETLQDRL